MHGSRIENVNIPTLTFKSKSIVVILAWKIKHFFGDTFRTIYLPARITATK